MAASAKGYAGECGAVDQDVQERSGLKHPCSCLARICCCSCLVSLVFLTVVVLNVVVHSERSTDILPRRQVHVRMKSVNLDNIKQAVNPFSRRLTVDPSDEDFDPDTLVLGTLARNDVKNLSHQLNAEGGHAEIDLDLCLDEACEEEMVLKGMEVADVPDGDEEQMMSASFTLPTGNVVNIDIRCDPTDADGDDCDLEEVPTSEEGEGRRLWGRRRRRRRRRRAAKVVQGPESRLLSPWEVQDAWLAEASGGQSLLGAVCFAE
eukprot:3876528-Amphidinium_carterae.1